MGKRQERNSEENNQDGNQRTIFVRDLRLNKPILKKVSFDTATTLKSLEIAVKKALDIDFKPILFHDDRKIEEIEELVTILKQKNGNTFGVRRNVNLSKLKSLRGKQQTVTEFPYGVVVVKDEPTKEVRKKIEGVAINFSLQALSDPARAGFRIPSRSTDNVGYEEDLKMVLMGNQFIDRTFRNLSSVQSVAQFSEMMRLCYAVLAENLHVTKRDLFYQSVNTFQEQRVSDGIIEDLGAALQVTRNSLNVIASAKGVVLGRLSFTEKGDRIDCSKGVGGRSITPMLDLVDNFESDAEFVLLIEKDAVFNRLAEDKFFDYLPSIIITAKGQPDLATRAFVKRLRNELQLPVLGFMDADPYGLDILRVYSMGSKAMSLETSELAVTDIKWLGLLPSDLKKYEIPSEALIPMSDKDNERAENMLKEDFVRARPRWEEELNIMLKTGKKAEIQALSSKHLRFMTNEYLPTKIDTNDWI
jgi:meiotic recombination protein SPO11